MLLRFQAGPLTGFQVELSRDVAVRFAKSLATAAMNLKNAAIVIDAQGVHLDLKTYTAETMPKTNGAG